MQRRDVLQWMGVAVGVPALLGISPDRLLAIGRAMHDRISSRPTPQRSRLLLDEHQDRTVATMAEHIIPETDTPGARAARVNEFIDLLLAEWFDEDQRSQFLRGLADVDAQSLNRFGTTFIDATDSQQVTILSDLEAEFIELRNTDIQSEHFFGSMKWLTLYGYYTSEIGQAQELQARIIPGRFEPCGPVNRDTPGEW
jgi:hypothetical protein